MTLEQTPVLGTAVLVHGLWSNPNDWDWVREPLESSNWNVITPDLPSHRSAQAGLIADAEEVARAITAARPPVVVMGWSYGGTVISVAAAEHTSVVRLIYVSAGPEPVQPGHEPDWVQQDEHVIVGDDGTCVLDHDWWLNEEAGATFPADVRARLRPRRPASLATSTDPQRAAAWETIPTTVIFGAEDEMSPEDYRVSVADRIPDVRVVACDHFILFRDPQLLVRTILENAPRPN